MKIFSLAFSYLPAKIKKRYVLLFVFSFFINFLEILGIGSLIPILDFLLNGNIFFEKFFLKLDLNKYFQDRISLVNLMFLIVFFIFFFKNIFISIYKHYELKNSSNTRIYMTNKIYNFYLNLSYKEYFITNLATKIRNSDLEVINYVTFISAIFTFLTEGILVFSFVTIALIIEPLVSSTLIFFAGIGLFLFMYKSNVVKKWGTQRQKHSKLYLKYLYHGLIGFVDIKLFAINNYFIKKLNFNLKNHTNFSRYQLFLNTIAKNIFEVLIVFGLVMVSIFLFKSGYSKTEIIIILSVSAAVIFKLIPSLIKVVIALNHINFCKPSIKIINEINYKFQKNEKEKKIDLIKKNISFLKELTLKNISFKYGSKKILFKNLNLIIKKNEFIGIYGPSGSGKSTLLDIISGLRKDYLGEVTIDGRSTKNINLRNMIGYVSQKSTIFNETIKFNVALSETNIQINKLNNAIIKSRAKEFIKNLQKKANTTVGEGGLKLSEGQKQRILLARAFYALPKIILLDESTNALDEKNEDRIFKDLKRLNKLGFTICAVSHNINLLRNYCSKIYLLNNKKLKRKK